MPLYVYALIRSVDCAPVAAKAVASEAPVEIVRLGDLAAIVSETDASEVLPVRRNALQHTRVLEEAMVSRPILPMRFGIIVDSRDKLEAVVHARTADLAMLLDELHGCIEVDVKTSWNADAFWKDFGVRHPDLARAGQALNSGDKNKTYYERIELGRKVEAAMTARRTAERHRLVEAMQPFARKLKELPVSDELQVSNHALLIGADDEAALFEAVRGFEVEGSGLFNVRFVAPVPAYNFVSISLDWQARAKEVA